jgi:hypothetical protein
MSQRSGGTGPTAASDSGGLASEATAPGAAAGFVFQFERALARLAEADSYDAEVGIETLDDVAVREGAELLLLEQDKHTVAGEVLTDRAFAFWHTLHLWATNGHHQARLYLVTNRELGGDLVRALAADDEDRAPAHDLLRLLKAAAVARPASGGKRQRTPSKLKREIEQVLALPDAALKQLLMRIRLVGAGQATLPTRASLAAQLGIPQEYDSEFVLHQVLGWLVSGAVAAWREDRPAWFSRGACLRVCNAALGRAARRRILPRPGHEVIVSSSERQRARNCAFVDQLAAIEASADDVEQAIEHYLQFGIERHRLVDEGDVPPDEWRDRGQRLVARWRNILRQTVRSLPGHPPPAIGLRVLELTTYDHRERICGEECDELYMTSGHYHRLADVATVWWSPTFGARNAD